MALEAVVFQQDLFGYNAKDLYSILGGNWSCDQLGHEKEEEEKSCCFESQTAQTSHYHANWNHDSLPTVVLPTTTTTTTTDHHLIKEWHHHPHNSSPEFDSTLLPTTASRPKRRRSKSKKNQQEIENQRMTHIAVERNRRKQMNEYLSVLRSLMPESYVQRGDQASIIGGAINFVKELEQRLQWLGTQKEKDKGGEGADGSSPSPAPPFSEFFTFPQYSTTGSVPSDSIISASAADSAGGNRNRAAADIEVTMVESHANLKIRSRRRPKQLLRMVSGLQCLRLTILHLNVTTVDQTVLYSLSVKVEDDCALTTVDDIATAVHQMLGRIQEEAMIN